MLNSAKGIVLQNIKYADNKVISKIFTNEYGILNIHFVAGHSKKTKTNATLFLPLTQLDFSFSFKENREIHQLVEAKCSYVYQTINLNFYKLCIAQFINEVMLKCLKDQTKNENLFNFLISILQWLDVNEDNYFNLHVYFLIEFTKYLGFYPLNNYDSLHQYFNTTEGKFTVTNYSYPFGFNKQQSQLIASLFLIDINNKIKIDSIDRKIIIECLLEYYRLHIANFNELKSYSVLIETLHS